MAEHPYKVGMILDGEQGGHCIVRGILDLGGPVLQLENCEKDGKPSAFLQILGSRTFLLRVDQMPSTAWRIRKEAGNG
jgi:hypothetical protein